MSNFYITYYARKHQKFITRKGWFDKPDGTKGKSFVSSKGQPMFNILGLGSRCMADGGRQS